MAQEAQGQLQGRVLGSVRLKRPPGCPGLAQPVQSHHPGSPEHHISLAAKTSLPPGSYSKCRARSQALREASRIPWQFHQTQRFLVEHFHFSESAALGSVCLSAAMGLEVGTQGKAPGTCSCPGCVGSAREETCNGLPHVLASSPPACSLSVNREACPS